MKDHPKRKGAAVLPFAINGNKVEPTKNQDDHIIFHMFIFSWKFRSPAMDAFSTCLWGATPPMLLHFEGLVKQSWDYWNCLCNICWNTFFRCGQKSLFKQWCWFIDGLQQSHQCGSIYFNLWLCMADSPFRAWPTARFLIQPGSNVARFQGGEIMSLPLEPHMGSSTDGPGDAGVPKEVAKDKGDGILGLALKWDNNELVRQRMRSGWNLLVHFDPKLKKMSNCSVDRTVPNVKVNVEILAPVCDWMRRSCRVPEIDSLESQVQQMFSMYNAKVDTKTIGDQAWSIRHLITVLRQTARPPKPGSPQGYSRCPKDHLPLKFSNKKTIAPKKMTIVIWNDLYVLLHLPLWPQDKDMQRLLQDLGILEIKDCMWFYGSLFLGFGQQNLKQFIVVCQAIASNKTMSVFDGYQNFQADGSLIIHRKVIAEAQD